MALRQIRIGSSENILQYDDADFPSAMETDQPIKAGTPVDPDDVLRLTDIGSMVGDVVGPAGAVADNLASFLNVTGKEIKDSGLSTANVSDAVAKRHTQGTDTALGAVGTKNPPIDADKVLYRDSTAADVLVTSTWTQVKAFLKTYFDTLYAELSSNVKFTADGGLAVKLTNKTGANSVKGKLVKADTANNDAVILVAVSDDECCGIFYEDGIADGAVTWVVVNGIADVLFEDNFGPTRGDWVATSATDAGYARAQASPAAAPQHFEEIGHCIETVAAGGAGTHVLARCVLHFN